MVTCSEIPLSHPEDESDNEHVVSDFAGVGQEVDEKLGNDRPRARRVCGTEFEAFFDD